MSFRDLPVDGCRYIDEAFNLPERRSGTIAQDWAEQFGGNSRTFDIGDAMGKLVAAMKSLQKRTRNSVQFS
jgi:hypothetical protein